MHKCAKNYLLSRSTAQGRKLNKNPMFAPPTSTVCSGDIAWLQKKKKESF
jgi:hypothetical protein